jgi:hypothetical protein
MFIAVPADRVDEVPVERLLANIEKNAQGLAPAEKARAIGRLHLLAYLRRAVSLPSYRERPGEVAEGKIDDCAKLDAQVGGMRPPGQPFPPAKPGERCEERSYSLGPRHELPAGAFDGPRGLDPHLAAAIRSYETARRLEPTNLRTRLALAFAYDRAGRLKSARSELRYVMYQGLRLIPPPTGEGMQSSDWETHVVVSEAVEHFDRIAKLWTDRRLIARMKKRLQESPPAMAVTPILVPLKQEANFDALVDRTSKVAFDFSGQGLPITAGWLTKDAAWLVWDPKEKGEIKGGFQLFGSVTWLASWNNGYAALGALDDNGDGFVSGKELEGLALWHDKDANGICDKGEVESVAAHGIVALTYAHEKVGEDLWVNEAGVKFDTGEVRPTYDWILRAGLIQAAH